LHYIPSQAGDLNQVYQRLQEPSRRWKSNKIIPEMEDRVKFNPMNDTRSEKIRQIPLFARLTENGLQAVEQAAHVQKVEEGNFVFYQDDAVERIYVLEEGRVMLTQLAPDGQQVILRVATPGMMIAAIGIVAGAVYPVTAQAAEDSRLLYWSQSEMLALIERFPVLALNAMRVLSGHVREFQDRYRELATERVERRLARTVIRLASQAGKKTDEGVLIDLQLTRQDLAEMTGTTLYTVSRIMSQWESQGLVQAGREKVLIRFPHGLVRIADDLPENPQKGQNTS